MFIMLAESVNKWEGHNHVPHTQLNENCREGIFPQMAVLVFPSITTITVKLCGDIYIRSRVV